MALYSVRSLHDACSRSSAMFRVTCIRRYKGFPNLKFVAHTGDETQPHGVWRVRDLVWGDNLGDKGVPSTAPVIHVIALPVCRQFCLAKSLNRAVVCQFSLVSCSRAPTAERAVALPRLCRLQRCRCRPSLMLMAIDSDRNCDLMSP